MNSRTTLVPSGWHGTIRNALVLVGLAAGIVCVTAPASAYLLDDPGNCPPGRKWDVSHPIKVRVLDDSVADYSRLRGSSASSDHTRMDRDIDAVIKPYNAIPGSRLVLERGSSINGDKGLANTDKENYGDQTIVIGFTSGTFDADKKAEAVTSRDPGACTIWVFGPPDDYECSGGICRSFSTKDQPAPPGNPSERTFLGILTHEMGHAVGLNHPDDNYAVRSGQAGPASLHPEQPYQAAGGVGQDGGLVLVRHGAGYDGGAQRSVARPT